jgi:hypothetical protein
MACLIINAAIDEGHTQEPAKKKMGKASCGSPFIQVDLTNNKDDQDQNPMFKVPPPQLSIFKHY